AVTAVGGSDVFLLRRAGADGSHVWARTFPGTSYENSTALAVDGSGNVAITGNYSGTENFGTGTLPAFGVSSIFVAKFHGDGPPVWANGYGSSAPYSETGNAVAFDPSGNVFATGYFAGTVAFGGGLLTSAGGADAFLLSLVP